MSAASDNQTFMVHVVSQEGLIYEGKATDVILKGSEGELGLKPGHSQLLTQVAPGPIRILGAEKPSVADAKDVVVGEDNERLLYISGGILEVQPECISILADTVERPEDVNEQAALDAKNKAEELLAQKGDIDYQKTQRDLAEAMAKLQVLELMRAKKKR